MNTVLIFPEDFLSDGFVKIGGRRFKHISEVISAEKGLSLSVGVINGKMGRGKIVAIYDDYLEMEIVLNEEPPPPLNLNLIMALPRPKMLKRVLESVTSLGVKKLWFINSWKVEKSFWGSPVLTENIIQKHLFLGLEQCKDTILPEVNIRKLFKPFVEDELPDIIEGTSAYVAHPGAGNLCPVNPGKNITLAIGPEGGFTDYEVTKLCDCGFVPVNLGSRILRVETAVPVIVSRLFAGL